MLNKKGSMLSSLIVALVVIIILFQLTASHGAEASSFRDRSICLTTSIASAEQSRFSAVCPPNFLEVKKDRFELNGQQLTGFGGITERSFKEIVATEMVKCWKRLGEGKYSKDIYGEGECSICVEIDFLQIEDEKPDLPPVMTGFHEYLQTNTLKSEDRPIYFDYFRKNNKHFNLNSVVNQFDTSKKYAIVNGKVLPHEYSSQCQDDNHPYCELQQGTAIMLYKNIPQSCKKLA